MPTKPSISKPTKPPMPSKQNLTSKDYDSRAKIWGKKLWGVVAPLNEREYFEKHDFFKKEFHKLRDEASGSENVSMLDHVAPIYNHITSHGYKASVHFPPLTVAITNFCKGLPVVDWKAPPDQLSRSPSPVRWPSSPPPPNANELPEDGTSKLPVKRKTVVSDELAQSEDEESDKEPAKPREAEKSRKTDVEAKSLPATDGMELSPTKCSLCEHRGHGCHVNPKATKKGVAAAACFECNHWRLKCTLAPNRTKKGDEEEPKKKKKVPEGEDEEPKKKKKTAQVPGASQPSKPVLNYI